MVQKAAVKLGNYTLATGKLITPQFNSDGVISPVTPFTNPLTRQDLLDAIGRNGAKQFPFLPPEDGFNDPVSTAITGAVDGAISSVTDVLEANAVNLLVILVGILLVIFTLISLTKEVV